MFGTIITNPDTMTDEDKARYHAHYCGLCHQLNASFGSVGSATLTYDMTFLSILLGALYNGDETAGARHCFTHPLKRHPFVCTEATAYAADLNLFLAYYQSMDDWQDDHNAIAHKKAKNMKPFLPDLRTKWPRQTAAIETGLAAIGKMEKANELNPDLPCNAFGKIMGELFVWKEDDYAADLYHMGAALGRYIYLLDAVNDLHADIKKERYNPLVSQMNTDFKPMLTLMMAECTDAFDRLPIDKDKRILQNVLYSGVWQSYIVKKKK